MTSDGAGEMTPSVARRRLGGELEKTRRRVKLSLVEAAKGIQRSSATLSRLESGKTIPREVDVRALLNHYRSISPQAVANGTEERILRLTAAAREGEWFGSFRDVLAGELTSNEARYLVEFEAAATSIRGYESELIPGLLQTPAYAAHITAAFFPDRGEEERQRLVEFRIERQRILRKSDPAVAYHALINEVALLRTVESGHVMREQLESLLEDVRGARPHVTVQVVPLKVAVPAVFGGPFVQMDLADESAPGVVYLEGRESSSFVRTEEAVERYGRMFADLGDAALDRDRSAALIEEVAKALP